VSPADAVLGTSPGSKRENTYRIDGEEVGSPIGGLPLQSQCPAGLEGVAYSPCFRYFRRLRAHRFLDPEDEVRAAEHALAETAARRDCADSRIVIA